MGKRITTFFRFIHQVTTEYIADNVIKYSASLSYYTTLSLAPMLVIIITASGILLGKEAMEGGIFKQINGLVGEAAAIQIEETIRNVQLSKDSTLAATISIIILLVGATGIFGEIQDSLNKIWGLRITNRKVWWKLILNRLISFSLILSLGFVMMVSLILYAVVATISTKFNSVIEGAGDTLLPVINHMLSLTISTLLFATIFKVLPDAKIKWKDVFVGAFITAILFTFGKWLIGIYLGKINLASVFGAAGSVIIIMIWVYYSSAILYLGAVVTKVYAINHGGNIHPNAYAVWIVEKQVPVSDVTLHEQTVIKID